jgi:drug/metabolite transporter (DMT)-like permease
VIIGLAPASTAVFAALRARRLPRPAQLVGVAFGAGAAAAFAAIQAGTLHLGRGDLLLLGAVAIIGAGYAEGGLLARPSELGSGWRVTCWSLVLSAPAVATTWWWVSPPIPAGTPGAWFGFAYVSVVSVLLASFAWYRGLAQGDLGRTSQIQLVQPVLSVGWAALLLGEPVSIATGLGAAAVMAAAAVVQRG